MTPLKGLLGRLLGKDDASLEGSDGRASAGEPSKESAEAPARAPALGPEGHPTIPQAPPPESDPAALLAGGLDLTRAEQEDAALSAFSALVGQRREARALELCRRLLAASAGGARLRLEVASLCVTRGDDRAAVDVLGPALEGSGVVLEALALAARAFARLGNDARARVLWQRVLARDVDYPGAREGVERGPSAAASGGATLAGGGELSGRRYRARRELGRGGAATVFEALDQQLGRVVAMKVYHRRGAAARARLRHEARVAAALEHPSVIRVFDLDEELAAVVMEWVRGPSLKQALAAAEAAPSEVARWLLGVVEALSFVHAAGYVHRDLKPSNVLIRRTGRPVLADFGLALPVGDTPTRAGEGTAGFAAPEQLRAGPASPAADVFSFGVILGQAAPRLPAGADWSSLAAACADPTPSARPGLAEVSGALRAVADGG